MNLINKNIADDIIQKRRQLCPDELCQINAKDLCASCPHDRWHMLLECGDNFFKDRAKKPSIDKEPVAFPDIKNLAKNATVAIVDELKARLNHVQPLEEKDIELRYSICRSCEFFHTISDRCTKCGCFLKTKTAWRSQKCPIGKW